MLISIRDIIERAVQVHYVSNSMLRFVAVLLMLIHSLLQAYATDDRKVWVLSWPGQVCLLFVLSISFVLVMLIDNPFLYHCAVWCIL